MESVMTDIAFHRSAGPGPIITGRLWQLAARIVRAIDRTLFAHRIRYDLGELSHRLRRDVGLIHD
jgi:hypothetical protein